MLRKKYAVFTMDVEAFTDTECVANSSQSVDVDLLDGFDEYMRILDKYNIKSTLFTVGSLAPKIVDRLSENIKNGHRLALHSYEHIAPMDVSEETFKYEISKSKQRLDSLFNTASSQQTFCSLIILSLIKNHRKSSISQSSVR